MKGNEGEKFMRELLIVIILLSGPAFGVECKYSSGPTMVSYDLTENLAATQNTVGSKFSIVANSDASVKAICKKDPSNPENVRTYRSYVTSLPISDTQGRYQYIKLNDYMSGAMEITDSSVGVFYPPANYVWMGEDGCVRDECPFSVDDSNITLTVRIDKAFIGSVNIPENKIFDVYATTTNVDPLVNVIYSISYSGEVIVPQSCELDAGTTITMDFGNIGAPLFSQAGAGNKPAGVNPQTHTVAVKCKNIDAQALLSMRLESDSVSGNAMVSDNKDVGFVVSGSDKVPLTPNDIDSKIKFQLDDNSAATVPITAWPVSVTGNKPAEGRFTSEGYLRIDFD